MVAARLLALLGLLAVVAGARLTARSDEAFVSQEFATNIGPYSKEAEADRVARLPGAPTTRHQPNIFSGYITVDKKAGRALFYVFVESTGRPANDPLVLWLNGGPGCSSLGGGFLAELGPYYPTPGGEQLIPNKFAWNQAANVLFLESPAFVGFSYSNTSADATVGDKRTAADSRQFMLGWLKRFPQYASHPFWLSGESYAGHYVPDLADEILRGNKEDANAKRINLQGFLVGNAWSDASIDNQGAVTFWYSHGIISTEMRDGILHNCNFSTVGPLRSAENASPDLYVAAVQGPNGAAPRPAGSKAEKCNRFVDGAMREMGDINIYDIYADVCLRGNAARQAQVRQLALMLRDHPAGASTRHMLKGAYDPCIDSETEAYLNRPDVQRALHANVSGKLPGPWQDCTPRIKYSRSDLLSSMLPVYRRLLKQGIRIMVYSGDVDAIVPVIGTRNWIRELDLPVTPHGRWHAWHSGTGQVGGWTVEHEGLTFASVRGAGHMVPYTQPERALYLFKKWVHQEPL
ncbi:serine carboxypeptidase 24-like [Micractinium conductrix]|uniref:Carboxypeptidase n=1 Tax=Micractinium conductrix TaxID=554055 RepID=A0A2P6VA51_9CHLO|nr:serine carboxypeptidase 24-like [Micractinium conductrix]|eukprot:PSC70972.1 serine carboxypeptidase 24-like [Micractinium conductrix]